MKLILKRDNNVFLSRDEQKPLAHMLAKMERYLDTGVNPNTRYVHGG